MKKKNHQKKLKRIGRQNDGANQQMLHLEREKYRLGGDGNGDGWEDDPYYSNGSRSGDTGDDGNEDEDEEKDNYPFDTLQALHTTLRYLARCNVDASEIEMFLLTHPESLLLEEGSSSVGAAAGVQHRGRFRSINYHHRNKMLLYEEEEHASARDILEDYISLCKCRDPHCNENREKILLLLSKGFDYYRREQRNVLHLRKPVNVAAGDGASSLQCSRQLTTFYQRIIEGLLPYERNIRGLRAKESRLRNRHYEAAVELSGCMEKLHQLQSERRGSSKHKKKKKKFLSLLDCSSRLLQCAKGSESTLEYHVTVSSLNMSSVEREEVDVLRKIRYARRAQFCLLESALRDGCVKRHECASASRLDDQQAPNQSNIVESFFEEESSYGEDSLLFCM